jgi:transposase
MGAYRAADPTSQARRKRSVDLREVVNCLIYVLSTGCRWLQAEHRSTISIGGIGAAPCNVSMMRFK